MNVSEMATAPSGDIGNNSFRTHRLQFMMLGQIAFLCFFCAFFIFPVELSAANARCPWSEPSDLILRSNADLVTVDRDLTVQEIREDFACLRDVFVKEYSAAFVYKKTGVSLEERVGNLADSIAKPMRPSQLVDELLKVHASAYDGHVRYLLNGEGGEVRKNLPAYKIFRIPFDFVQNGDAWRQINSENIVLDCGEFLPRRSIDGNGQTDRYVFVHQASGNFPKVGTCKTTDGSSKTYPVEPALLDRLGTRANEFYFEEQGSYLYVRMPTMSPGISPKQQELIDFLTSKSERPIVFDLRQNGGGDDSFAYRLAEVLRSRSQKLPGISALNLESLYSRASTANIFFVLWQKILRQGQTELAQRYERNYKLYREKFRQAVLTGETMTSFSTRTIAPALRFGERAMPYSKPIVLLADKGCASACESMVELFRELENVRVIGLDTGGFLHFGNLGAMVLPHSKIAIWSGWTAFDFPSGVKEGLGYAPTYYSLEGDSLKAAAAWLERQKLQ